MSDELPRAERRVLLALAGTATAVLTGALFALRGGSASADELAGQPEQSIPSKRTAEGVDSAVISGESQDDPVSGGDRMP